MFTKRGKVSGDEQSGDAETEPTSADTNAQEALLFRTGAGEAVLEAKVGGGDIIAVLSCFLLAISLGELRPGPA